MIKNFLFILKRFQTAAVLNIAGLSVAFAVFTITMIQCWYDFSYNRNFQNAKDIYRFSYHPEPSGTQWPSISIPLALELQHQYPEIQASCILDDSEDIPFRLQENAADVVPLYLTKTNEDFLKVFTPKILTGDAPSAFTERNKAMLTDDVAKRLFGKENPVGKVIFQDTVAYTVVAVCKRFPDNCSLKNGVYTTLLGEKAYDKMEWLSYAGYFLLDPKDVKRLEEKIEGKEYGEDSKLTKVQMLPFTKLYFSNIGWGHDSGNLNTTLSFMAIGVISLLIAFINLMNFSVAMIPSRVRGMNIKKIVGANRWNLRFLTASEAPLFAFVSFLIGLFLVAVFQDTPLSAYFSANLTITRNWGILGAILLAGLAISVLFGLYPARKVTSYQPAMALSGSFVHSKPSGALRNMLITFQFVAAITLICVALFNKMQYDFMTNHSWGFNKDNVVYLTIPSKIMDTYENEIKGNSDILDITVASDIPGHIVQTYYIKIREREVMFAVWLVRNDFLDFFDIQIIEGRNFIPDDNGKARIICNQEFLKKYNFSDIGAVMGDRNFEIIGIAANSNFESLHSAIRPLSFITQSFDGLFYSPHFFIRLSPENTFQTIDFLKEKWKKLSDEPFELKFLDDTLNDLYQTEIMLARLITVFGIIAVIIAIMGVYGLIVFNAKYRAKEIAIRKVNGADVREIIAMLNRNILIQLIMAFVIATPLAYFIVHRWLANFAYKTPVYWWVFLLGGIIVFVITLLTVSYQSYKAAKTNPTATLAP